MTTTVTEVNMDLEVEVLTDKTPTKTVPCRKCGRGCVVTLFATPSKTECLTCRGKKKAQHKEQVQVKQAHTVDPATLEHLADGLVNPVFKVIPVCPFNPDHDVELKSICHSPNYGPRHLQGYDSKGLPKYDQETGESVVYQCNDCRVVISYSTMHPFNLMAQNEPRQGGTGSGMVLASMLGVRDEAA